MSQEIHYQLVRTLRMRSVMLG